jgi:hypothetical protein
MRRKKRVPNWQSWRLRLISLIDILIVEAIRLCFEIREFHA